MTIRELSSLPLETYEIIARHQQHPPIKISQIAHALGGVKVLSAALPKGITGEIRPDPAEPGGYVIRVNKDDPARRQRFTVAHELAHYLLHRDEIGEGVEDDVLYRSSLTNAQEAEANRLAADLLMPQVLLNDWIARAATLRVDNVVEFLSDKFNVSQSVLKLRLNLK